MSVRFAILGLLAQKPRHGYELRRAFEALAGGEETWDVKPAQVYATLARLQEAGLVKSESPVQPREPEKRIHTITRQGQEALMEWFETPAAPPRQRDEFFIKLMVALMNGNVDIRHVLQVQRAELYRQLHNATSQRDACNPRQELAQILLLDKAIMNLEADLRWLDIVETRLEEVRSQPVPEPELRPRGRPRKTKKEEVDHVPH